MPQRVQPQGETETEKDNTMKNHAEFNFRMKNYCMYFLGFHNQFWMQFTYGFVLWLGKVKISWQQPGSITYIEILMSIR